MHSSISNSRFIIFFLSFALFLFLGTFLRPGPKLEGLPRLQQLSRKMGWHAQFDIVIGGDSRVQRGVSPKAMQEVLVKARVANFGFSALCLDEGYLNRLESLLDPKSKSPTIILGITPLSLSSYGTKKSEYHEYYEKHSAEHFLNDHFGSLIHLFRAYKKDDLKRLLGWTIEENPHYQAIQDDGWIKSNRTPPLPLEALDMYKKLFSEHHFLPKVEERLLKKVEELTKKDIAMYAFRPPTTKELAKLEKSICAFNQEVFIRKFKKRGGRWIDISEDDYFSYDGSHIDGSSAQRLSIKIAKILAKQGH